ncbi:MAG: TonB-dependent receptor [Caulobacteraceae bacterium]
MTSTTFGLRRLLLGASAFGMIALAAPSFAAETAPVATQADAAAADAPATPAPGVGEVVVSLKRTRSAVTLPGPEIQKILPGVNPLKAIQTLPGVTYETADPWGNNEQNITLFIHGFNAQQLGYTLDGVPLGDQNYGNFNGLSPQRAVISENVGSVTLSSGAGDLATASTSNLGGTIDTFTNDPKKVAGGQVAQTFGSYDAFRTYARLDSGLFAIPGWAGENSAYVSFDRQEARAWDFNGQQGGYQANGKFIHEDEKSKLTLYFDWSTKTEPNEDAVVHTPATDKTPDPYTRPYLYPNFGAAETYLTSAAEATNNYSNYYSDAQRTDYLGYAKYDYNFSNDLKLSNQIYFHHDDGQGQVAGPISAAGLPALFAVYYPGQNLSTVFGGSGYALRTTEYQVNREGLVSSFDWNTGPNSFEVGLWYEHDASTARRRWYAVPVADPENPYEPAPVADREFTQYSSEIDVNVIQPHIQDSYQLLPNLKLAAGFKSSLQYAHGIVPVQPLPGTLAGTSTALPQGEIDTEVAFLPDFGAIWDATEHEQVFANVQKNVRQFENYVGGLSAFSLGSQAAFDEFKDNTQPETSWTYEIGLRSHHNFDFGPLTGIEGQVNYYHVDFSNRLLSISPTSVITSIVGGVPIIENVGSVTTDGVDLAGTLHFGPHFSVYDSLSYNRSVYDDNYVSGTTTVDTAGKAVPASPNWLNKLVASTNFGPFEAQIFGDYVGKRYATYTNDLAVPSYFQLNLEASYQVPVPADYRLKDTMVRLNVTNLTNTKGVSTVVVGAASGTYNTYPIAPIMVFLTLSAGF